MEKQTYTPGPWEVSSGMVQTVALHKCKTANCGVHIPIAHMDREPGNGTLPVERDANAVLVAAAPELLEALRDLRREIRSVLRFDVKKHYSLMVADVAADKAIAKAEGTI